MNFRNGVLLLFTILIMTSCDKTVKLDGYRLTGTVKGMDTAWIKLTRNNFTDRNALWTVLDSVYMENGSFLMEGKVESPDHMNIAIGEKYYGRFFMENSDIKLVFDIATAEKRDGQIVPEVSGSEGQEELDIQSAKEDSIRNQEKFVVLNEIRAEMEKAYKSQDEDLIAKVKMRQAATRALSNQQNEEYRNSKFDYVRNHPESAVSTAVLGFQFSEGRMSRELMQEFYDLLKGDATKTAMYEYYKKTYTEIFETMTEGSMAPDFTLKTVDGDELTLSEVEGKYILVDFWASWCVPCRASFPHLKELQKKYGKDGFVIVGIGTADVEAKWRKAIIDDQITWNHLFDNMEGLDSHAWGEVASLYGVPFLPTTFLMDKNLTIVGRNLRNKDLDAKMEELFGY